MNRRLASICPGWRVAMWRWSATVLLVLAGRPLSAAASDPGALREIVVLDVRPELGDRDGLVETVRVHCTDIQARVTALRLPVAPSSRQERIAAAVDLGRARGAAAVLWIENAEDRLLTIYWVEPKQPRVWMRQLSSALDGFDATREKAALVARSGVEALLDAGSVAADAVVLAPPEREPPVEAAATLKASTSQDRRRILAAGLGYDGDTFAREVAWQSGIHVEVQWSPLPWFYAGVKYAWFAPVSVSSAELSASVMRHPAELLAGYRLPRRLAVRLELGLIADYTTRSTASADVGLLPTNDVHRLLLGCAQRAGIDWVATDRVRLFALAGTDVIFNNFDYLVDGATRRPALRPRSARATAELGAIVEIW